MGDESDASAWVAAILEHIDYSNSLAVRKSISRWPELGGVGWDVLVPLCCGGGLYCCRQSHSVVISILLFYKIYCMVRSSRCLRTALKVAKRGERVGDRVIGWWELSPLSPFDKKNGMWSIDWQVMWCDERDSWYDRRGITNNVKICADDEPSFKRFIIIIIIYS